MSQAQTEGFFEIAPQPGPQTVLLACNATEVFFGGALGAGKSYALALDFLNHWRKNGGGKKISGIVIRMSVPELADLIKTFEEVLEPFGWEFSVGVKTFKHPDGATCRMRHCETEKDRRKHWGFQYTWMGVDELGDMPEETFNAIQKLRAARLRSAAGVPVRFVATANPCGAGHVPCKQRYIDPAPAFTPFKDPESGHDIIFIPGRMTDNLLMLQNDPSYQKRVRSMTGPKWYIEALINGDWNISPEGNMFPRSVFEHRFSLANPPKFWFKLVSWDTAFKTTKDSARSAGVCLGLNEAGIFLLDAWAKKVEFPELVRQTQVMHRSNAPCNLTIIEDKASGQSLIQTLKDPDVIKSMVDDVPIPIKAVKVDGDKLRRAFAITPYFEQGKFFVPESAPWLNEYVEEMCAFPTPTGYVDYVDATSQGVTELMKIKKRLEIFTAPKVSQFNQSIFAR